MKLRRFVMARRRGVVAVVAAALVATAAPPLGAVATTGPEPAPATSSVRDWNLNALNALVKPTDAPEPGAGQTPPVTLLHMAMVHGAIYDAVNAIDGGYQPYLPDLQPASPSASVDAAVATAAHDVLVGLSTDPPLPEAVVTRLDGLYEEALAAIPDGADKTDGIAAGADAAAAMLAARADDGRYVPFSHPVGDQPGEWRPAPPDEISDPIAWVANVAAVPDRQLVTVPHGWAERARQRRVHHRVQRGQGPRRRRRRRAAPSNRPSPTSTTSMPTELFNRTLRTVAETEGLSVADEARLFAMANLIGADTIITCWGEKAYWHFWRPITAIHEGDNDGNDDTVGDPTWEPMLADAAVSGPHLRLQLRLLGIHVRRRRLLRRGTDRLQRRQDRARRTRRDPRVRAFTDVVDDTIDARVFQGLHFRAADVQGAEIGANVAEWVATNYFQPAGAATTSTT